MLFGLCACLVVVENDHGCVFWVLFSPFPALHRCTHKADHFVSEGRIVEVFFEDIETVLKGCDAHVFVFEGDEFIGRNASLKHLTEFVVGHGRDTVGLTLQERVNVKALLQDRHATLATISGDTLLAHPRQERIFVAVEPNADGVTREICGASDAAVFPAG